MRIAILCLVASILLVICIIPSTSDDKTAGYWLSKANSYYKAGSYDIVLLAVNKSLELDPSNKDAWKLKGDSFSALNMSKNALACYDKEDELNFSAVERSFNAEKPADADTLTSGVNPAWMELFTLTEGDGFAGYVTLYNRNNAMVRSDGTLRLDICDMNDEVLKRLSYNVKSNDFVDTQAGIGAFEHDVTIWVIPRISSSEIPGASGTSSTDLHLYAFFDTPDGSSIKSNQEVQFV